MKTLSDKRIFRLYKRIYNGIGPDIFGLAWNTAAFIAPVKTHVLKCLLNEFSSRKPQTTPQS